MHSLSTGTHFVSNLKEKTSYFVSILMFLCVFSSTQGVSAITQNFQAGTVLTDQDFYGIPRDLTLPRNDRESGISQIQNFLEDKNSILATYRPMVSFSTVKLGNINFMSSSIYIDQGLGDYDPNLNWSQYLGKRLSVAEIIWILSQEQGGKVCSIKGSGYSQIYKQRNGGKYFCSNKTINPYLLLALVQKESGLVYGSNSQKSQSESQWYLDRATGYACSEGARNKSCYDSNPQWINNKGLFKQLYASAKWLKIVADTCVIDNSNGDGKIDPDADIGQIRYIDGQAVRIETSFACAHYWYTPHIHGNRLLYNIYKAILPEGPVMLERRTIKPRTIPMYIVRPKTEPMILE